MSIKTFAAAFAVLLPTFAIADASGPDYFRVHGVTSQSALNIRARPSVRSARLGTIPPDATRLRNLGCVGEMSYEEWEAATPGERNAARQRVWCKVQYRTVEGWVAGRFLTEDGSP